MVDKTSKPVRKAAKPSVTTTAVPFADAVPVSASAKPTGVKPAPRVPEAPALPQPDAAAPVATPAPAVKEVTMDTIDTAKTAAETATAKAQGFMNEAGDRAKGAMEKGQKIMEEAADFGRGNVEALVESSRIAARGFEALSHDGLAYAKKAFEEATAAAKQMAGVKSPTELMKLQADYARNAFDALVAESSARAETMLKLAGEVAQPISNRVALAAEKMKVSA